MPSIVEGIGIRSALEADAACIASILIATGWFEYVAAAAQEEAIQRIASHIELCLVGKSHSVYVAETGNGEVVGYVSVHWLPSLFLPAPEGYLSDLFIEATHRGKGIARELLAVVEREAKDRGASRLALITNRNREAYRRRFYSKMGWIERDNMANFVFDLSTADQC